MATETTSYGKMIKVTRLEYNMLKEGDLIENLEHPYEMGLVEKVLSYERCLNDQRLLSTYLVVTY